MNSIFLSWILAILLYSSGVSNLFQEKPLLWRAGKMLLDAVQGETGDTWLALCHTAKGYELVSTKITILEDSPIGDIPCANVILDCNCSAIFLVYGVPELKPGSINTVFNGVTRLKPSQSITLQLTSELKSTYSLSASGSEKGEYVRNYKIELFSDQKKQLILTQASTSTGIYLLWAGDLDCDGKLDFLIDLNDSECGSEHSLFLSSKAKKGDLVKRYISYRTHCL
jgi:hypothetical protein